MHALQLVGASQRTSFEACPQRCCLRYRTAAAAAAEAAGEGRCCQPAMAPIHLTLLCHACVYLPCLIQVPIMPRHWVSGALKIKIQGQSTPPPSALGARLGPGGRGCSVLQVPSWRAGQRASWARGPMASECAVPLPPHSQNLPQQDAAAAAECRRRPVAGDRGAELCRPVCG